MFLVNISIAYFAHVYPQSPEETDVITRHDDTYNIHDHSQLVNVVQSISLNILKTKRSVISENTVDPVMNKGLLAPFV